jgi:TfoX/Sxy family transcriptional regulator of competence genes
MLSRVRLLSPVIPPPFYSSPTMSTLSESQRALVDRIARFLPDVEARMMLGTIGLYANDEQFGLLDGEDVYLRAGEAHRETFEAQGATPYSSSGGIAQASYFRVPDAVLDEDEALSTWLTYAAEEAG